MYKLDLYIETKTNIVDQKIAIKQKSWEFLNNHHDSDYDIYYVDIKSHNSILIGSYCHRNDNSIPALCLILRNILKGKLKSIKLTYTNLYINNDIILQLR